MTVLLANNDLVAVAWIKAALGLTGGVGTELPGDTSTWAASGFIQVGPVVGGASSAYNSQRAPVLSIECWAVTPNSRRPPWGAANTLAERVWAACGAVPTSNRAVTLPAGFPKVMVHGAVALTDPRRIYGDDSAFAHYQFDVSLTWKAVP